MSHDMSDLAAHVELADSIGAVLRTVFVTAGDGVRALRDLRRTCQINCAKAGEQKEQVENDWTHRSQSITRLGEFAARAVRLQRGWSARVSRFPKRSPARSSFAPC